MKFNIMSKPKVEQVGFAHRHSKSPSLIAKEVYKFIRRSKRFLIVSTYKYSQHDYCVHIKINLFFFLFFCSLLHV